VARELNSLADKYQKLATECLLRAKTASDPVNRITLLQPAGIWLKLAEQVASAKQTEDSESS
jgi:hypothetical protein